MNTPALTALKSRFPKARVSVLALPRVAPVFTAHPAVDEVLVLDTQGGGLALRHRAAQVRRLREGRFDLALVFPNSFDAAFLTWLARIPRRVGYATDCRRLFLTTPVAVPENRGRVHEIYYYLALVDTLARRAGGPEGGVGTPALSLAVPGPGQVRADRILQEIREGSTGPLIGFNPGAAYGPAKCWPAERFAALGGELLERYPGARILVLGTRNELAVAAEICRPLGGRCCNLAGRTSLGEVMGVIARLDLLVTNDSGLMHVGAALGKPLVAIFGSTNPLTTGPWSERGTVIRHALPCSPCLKRTCPEDFSCMLGIGAEEVFQACVDRLEGG